MATQFTPVHLHGHLLVDTTVCVFSIPCENFGQNRSRLPKDTIHPETITWVNIAGLPKDSIHPETIKHQTNKQRYSFSFTMSSWPNNCTTTDWQIPTSSNSTCGPKIFTWITGMQSTAQINGIHSCCSMHHTVEDC